LEVESATLGGVNRTNWPASGVSGADVTNIVGDENSTGTVNNASNLDGVAASAYVTNGGATVNGQAVSNGAAITISEQYGQKAVLVQGTNYAIEAITQTEMPAANYTIVQSASWLTSGSTVSNTIASLDAGRYLLSAHSQFSGAANDARMLLRAVSGGASNNISIGRSDVATAALNFTTPTISCAYTSNAVPWGLALNFYGSVKQTNIAYLTVITIERLP
jgi:hypothetical protein